MKDGRISGLNATIKSLNTKINGLEKSLERLQSKFATFQCQSATDIAKLQHKKELIEIKDQKKRDTMEQRKKERSREKEIQKRKLQDVNSMHNDFIGVARQNGKKVQERIINNFRSFDTSSYLQQSSQHPPFVSIHQPQPASQHPYYYT